MFLGVNDIFRVGVGPSSSHTVGPMIAAGRFLALLRGGDAIIPGAGDLAGVSCKLYGSLSLTGRGHATDRAVILGLSGFRPDDFDAKAADATIALVEKTQQLEPPGLPPLTFRMKEDLIFDLGPPLPGHVNGMVLTARDTRGQAYAQETYYSVGGGFVQTEAELTAPEPDAVGDALPYVYDTAADLLAACRSSGLSIAEITRANEAARGNAKTLDASIGQLWEAMNRSIDLGLATDGTLPGGLNVRRRAKGIHEALLRERGLNQPAPHTINDWISIYAMAVNEVNAAGGQIVTAPTNGAAGVVPATLRYYLDHMPGAQTAKIPEFFLTATAIGALIKRNASISGAEVGCQGEVGSASAMAAAALCAVLGGTPEQVENAAEIALEHHLGMTCDPIRGLVQAPCIERNGLGAIKAVSAASLSLRGDGKHLVSLDACIETMRQTGFDMSHKYKETSLGGLAVNVPEC